MGVELGRRWTKFHVTQLGAGVFFLRTSDETSTCVNFRYVIYLVDSALDGDDC